MFKRFNIKKISLIVVAIIGISSAGFVLKVSAVTTHESESEYRVSEGETINDDLFVSSNRVVIEGIVNGDVYAAGADVAIRGVVNGDVFAAGNSIEVTGTIRDDLYAAGQTVSLNKAEIGDSFVGFGSTVKTTTDTTINGGVITAGSIITLAGDVGRGVMAAGDNIILDARVARNNVIATDKLTIGENAKIDRDINLYSEKQAKRETGAQVIGNINLKQTKSGKESTYFGGLVARIVAATFFLFANLIIGLAAVYFFRHSTERIVKIKPKDYGQTFIWGIIVALVGLPISFLLMFTVVGLPLGLITFTLWMIASLTAKIPGSYLIGKYLLQKRNIDKKSEEEVPLIAPLGLGLFIYYLLSIIPFVGGLIGVLISTLGLGVFVMVYPHRRAKRTSTKKTKVA